MDKENTMQILEQFFGECLRYWERTLKVNSDESKEPYLHAIEEIPSVNPYKIKGEPLNPDCVAEFKKYRLMDCYAKEWEKHV